MLDSMLKVVWSGLKYNVHVPAADSIRRQCFPENFDSTGFNFFHSLADLRGSSILTAPSGSKKKSKEAHSQYHIHMSMVAITSIICTCLWRHMVELQRFTEILSYRDSFSDDTRIVS